MKNRKVRTSWDEECPAGLERDSVTFVDHVAEENISLFGRQRPVFIQLKILLGRFDEPKYLKIRKKSD